MAQRISRAKRTVSGVRLNQAGGRRHGAARALPGLQRGLLPATSTSPPRRFRLTRQLAAMINHEEVAGLLALMLLHHARRPERTPRREARAARRAGPRPVEYPPDREGVDVLQTALTRDRLGEFQAQAAIAALPRRRPDGRGDRLGADRRVVRTNWCASTESPVARLNRAVAVGEADGPRAGLAALAELDPALPRHAAAAAYLHERGGDPVTAARLYAEAARVAPNLPEREHLTRQAARLNAQLRS